MVHFQEARASGSNLERIKKGKPSSPHLYISGTHFILHSKWQAAGWCLIFRNPRRMAKRDAVNLNGGAMRAERAHRLFFATLIS